MKLKLIDLTTLEALTRKAAESPRKRANHNLHPALDDPIQRLCIAGEPGTYFRPNCHRDPDTWELLVGIRGAFVLLTFNEEGMVLERHVIAPGGDVVGIEISPRTWHTLVAMEQGSIFLEVKQGPYHPIAEKDFAAWSPPEGHAAAQTFVEWFLTAKQGDGPPRW